MLLNHIKHIHIYTHRMTQFSVDLRFTEPDATSSLERVTSQRNGIIISAAKLTNPPPPQCRNTSLSSSEIQQHLNQFPLTEKHFE
jgi:hypothetical protein